MADRKVRARSWWRRCMVSAAVGLGPVSSLLYGQDDRPVQRPAPMDLAVVPAQATENSSPFFPSTTVSDPLAPEWLDPVSRVPNFFGDFFARGAQASSNTTRILEFTGVGAEGFSGGGFVIVGTPPPLTASGQGHTYTLNPIPYTPTPPGVKSPLP